MVQTAKLLMLAAVVPPFCVLTLAYENTSRTRETPKMDTTATINNKSDHNNNASKTVSAGQSNLPLVINTWAFRQANAHAWHVLLQRDGGIKQTLDAVVEGCTVCERLQCDGTVGFGGSPDEFGETTLDAMVMDGANMNIGAVAGMRRIKDAAHVAKHVLQHTRHTLLVGDAATKFAVAMGFKEESLSTDKSHAMWQDWLAGNCQPNFWQNVNPDPKVACGPYTPQSLQWQEQRSRYEYNIGAENHDTIGMIAIDVEGQIHAGTSTNGARHKIAGRVGDSPIPGAGAYADNEVGAAVATGDGDIMMRFLPSLLAVEALRAGKQPSEAADGAMRRILQHYPDFRGALVVVNKYGNYSAACVGMSEFPYSVTHRNSAQVAHVEYAKCIALSEQTPETNRKR